jgi:hypothetical protein
LNVFGEMSALVRRIDIIAERSGSVFSH